MSSATPDLGRDVDAFCSRCQMVLAHTVTAKLGNQIVRVICNTCKAEHRYRPSAGASAPRRRREADPVRQPKTRAQRSDFDRLVAGKDLSSARPYSPRETFTQGELLQHPSFGVGVVSAVKTGGKVEVVFPSSVKVLLHGR